MSEILGFQGVAGGDLGGDSNKPSDANATKKAQADHDVKEVPADSPADTTSQDAGGDETTSDGGDKSGWDTGIDGIKANGNKGGLPVFDVTPEEFYRNMKLDRRKLVFNRGTPAQQYHSKTNYKQHFWIRNTKDGYMKKVGKDWMK
jgi:hypothetical protein